MTYFWVMLGSALGGGVQYIVSGLAAQHIRKTFQFVMTGLCGGYTTFSSFSLQTLNLARDGETLLAGANMVLSVVLCLLAVWAGYVAANALNQLKGT